MVEIVAQRATSGLPPWCGSLEDPDGPVGPASLEEPLPDLGSDI
jgi:hypothetical protein